MASLPEESGTAASGISELRECGDQGGEMDRRSWLWKRKSSHGDSENCGREMCSDDQELKKASANIASKEDTGTIKSLTDELSSALLNISAKEDLVNQHAKVAEEAVSGWEKAEKDVVSLRRQLEIATQNNSALEHKISLLDEAFKECVKQLQQTREEQEQKVQNALLKKTNEWESEKLKLESQLGDLELQLEAAKIQATVSNDLEFKLEELEKENAIIKSELLALSEELGRRTFERDLCNRAAETASRQHLDSIRKISKLEAEFRLLQAMVHKSSSTNQKLQSDSQQKTSVKILTSPSFAGLDQFMSKNAFGQNRTDMSSETDLMDDFLEMEKFVLSEEINQDRSLMDSQTDISTIDIMTRNSSLEAELKAVLERISELEKTERRMETEKAEAERLLRDTHDQLKITSEQLKETEMKMVDIQREIQLTKDSKQAAETSARVTEVQKRLLESRLESADLKIQELNEMVVLLEGKFQDERVLSEELTKKCQNLEDELLKRKREVEIRLATISNGEWKIKQEKELSLAANKFADCQMTITSISQQLTSLATLDDFVFEDEDMELDGRSPPFLQPQGTRKTGVSKSDSLDTIGGSLVVAAV